MKDLRDLSVSAGLQVLGLPKIVCETPRWPYPAATTRFDLTLRFLSRALEPLVCFLTKWLQFPVGTRIRDGYSSEYNPPACL